MGTHSPSQWNMQPVQGMCDLLDNAWGQGSSHPLPDSGLFSRHPTYAGTMSLHTMRELVDGVTVPGPPS